MSFEFLTEDDLKVLIEEKTPEGVELEFKSERITQKELNQAIRDLSCEISAFANSAGGKLIIGVEEENGEGNSAPPVADAIRGITNPKWKAEWLASKLEEKISPKIEGLSVKEIDLTDGGICLVVNVPISARAPHQSEDKKYYARRQFQKMPMAHYEIEDIRNRQRVKRTDVRLEIFFDRGVFVDLSVENIGDQPVYDLKFEFPDETLDVFKLDAPALLNGLTALNPGEKLRFYLGGIQELFGHDVLRKDNCISVHYRHENNQEDYRFVIFNLSNHDRSSFLNSDIDHLRKEVVKQLKETTNAVKNVGELIKTSLSPLCGPTGLSVSHDTLNRLSGSNATDTRWNAELLNRHGFQEVLDCSFEEAYALDQYFSWRGQMKEKLSDLEGMTPELMQKIKNKLKLPGQEVD